VGAEAFDGQARQPSNAGQFLVGMDMPTSEPPHAGIDLEMDIDLAPQRARDPIKTLRLFIGKSVTVNFCRIASSISSGKVALSKRMGRRTPASRIAEPSATLATPSQSRPMASNSRAIGTSPCP